jgi:putative membrane protein
MADSDDLALQRTFLAHERTVMAWVRTATSLISFGFGIYKFFQYLSESSGPRPDRFFGPREFALIMIALGVLALAMAAYQYKQNLKLLEQRFGAKYRSLAGSLAVLVSIMAFGLLAVVWLHK